MSLSSPNATEVYDINVLRSVPTRNYFLISYFALIFYECMITLDHEITYVWKYCRTATTLLLLSNRCFLIMSALARWPFPLSDNVKSCSVPVILQYIVTALGYLILAVFSSLRIYAINSGKWRYALVTLVLGLSATGVYLYSGITVTDVTISKVVNVNICNYNFDGNGTDTYLITTALSVACLIVSESIVAIATWIYTSHWRQYIKQPNSRALLVTTMYVNGTVYFLTLLVTSIVNGVLILASRTATADYVANFVIALPNILLSRFIHDLRQASTSQGMEVGIDQLDTAQESICFASNVVGNIGEPLDHGSFRDPTADDDYGDEEEAECVEADNLRSWREEIMQTMSM